MSGLWKPNRPGDGPYHINNYYAPMPVNYDYHNILDRVDYAHSDKLRFFGRYQQAVDAGRYVEPHGVGVVPFRSRQPT
jgi:hypothetical protein